MGYETELSALFAEQGPSRRFKFKDGTDYQILLRDDVPELSSDEWDMIEQQLVDGTLHEQLAARDRVWAAINDDARAAIIARQTRIAEIYRVIKEDAER